jgi:hypothetical protein
MGKSPFFMGKSQFFIGKSTIVDGNSLFIFFGKSTINDHFPSFSIAILTWPEATSCRSKRCLGWIPVAQRLKRVARTAAWRGLFSPRVWVNALETTWNFSDFMAYMGYTLRQKMGCSFLKFCKNGIHRDDVFLTKMGSILETNDYLT